MALCFTALFGVLIEKVLKAHGSLHAFGLFSGLF